MGGYDEVRGSILVRALVERIRELPGVADATAAFGVPGPGGRGILLGGLTVPGVSPPAGGRFFEPLWNIVEPGYFATLRVPIVAGRDFNEADRAATEPVAIVSESAARRFWPEQEAVGKRMVLQSSTDATGQAARGLRVIGVAGDVKSSTHARREARGSAPAEDTSSLFMYLPLQQHYIRGVTLITRAAGNQRVTNAVRAAVASMDPNLPVVSTQRLAEPAGPIQFQLRLAASVSGSLGLVGLLVAAIGIYGTAYAVTCRAREIGIRAPGCQRSDVVGMVLRHEPGRRRQRDRRSRRRDEPRDAAALRRSVD